MSEQFYPYIIIGAGLAGVSAIEGIREKDQSRPILLIGAETFLPYHRPPLSKKLWLSPMEVKEIYIHNEKYYFDQGVRREQGIQVVGLDPDRKLIGDSVGNCYRYEKLLLATGGSPKIIPVHGAYQDGICFYRNLGDYLKIRSQIEDGKTALIVGGGFIGSEMAAALNMNHMKVFWIFPEQYPVHHTFPEDLGLAIQKRFIERGVRVITRDIPVAFERKGTQFITRTRRGEVIESDFVIIGAGITPSTQLAEVGDLEVSNGIVVNAMLQTSNPHIFAAGDNAYFPYEALGRKERVEHWDNALHQGKTAGVNMAGGSESYQYMPYFFSDLFDFSYETVGESSPNSFETYSDWENQDDTGIIYYLNKNRIICGAMVCNIPGKMDEMRELIRKKVSIDQIIGEKDTRKLAAG